jgi:predicted RNase H-like HicB family nuclease
MEVFDVFSGRLEQEPMWLETAKSLTEASERMKQRARNKPGPYFVFCCETRQIVESIDTSDSAADRASAA